MKKYIFIILLMIIPLSVSADLMFEYEMSTSVVSDEASDMLISHERNYVSEVGLKILQVESQTATIIRTDKKVIWEIDLGNNFYTETTFDQVEKMRTNQPPMANIDVESTSIEENVCGYNSKKYLVYIDGELASEVWATLDKPFDENFVDFYKNYSSFTAGSFSELNEISGFPVQTTFSTEAGGAKIETQSFLKSVTDKKIDKSEFELPEGIIKINAPLMPNK